MTLQVISSATANNNSPVAMDVVMASDKKLMDVIGGMTASDWFQKRAQVQLDHPGKVKILTDLELVPGQPFGPVKYSVEPKFVGGFIFLNYFTPGPHRRPRRCATLSRYHPLGGRIANQRVNARCFPPLRLA